MPRLSPSDDPRQLGPWLEGANVADVYDSWCESLVSLDTEGAVASLVKLAGQGPVLELAIGTGRLALPLADHGLEVHGIDASEEMVAQLRGKPGGDRIPVTIGDLVDVDVEGRFRLIFVAFNTFFGLRSREDQARCFARVAGHLTDDGVFVIEASVPDLTRFDDGEQISRRRVDFDDMTVVDVARHDPTAQRVESEHILIREGEVRVVPFSIRYAYASELDRMAALAGLRLREHWGGWRGERLMDDSRPSVSIYEQTP
jgi:predicted TPR repeat methyltransferase